MASNPSRRNVWVAVVVVAIAAAGGWWAWSRHNENIAAAQHKTEKAPAPVPVTVTSAKKGDFPVYLFGLGVVQPYDTVTLSSRVDGAIEKVFFKQGQMVKEGETLVKIDPRPYQAALDQATAKRDADQANLKNAQLNLQRYQTLGEKDFASRQQIDTQQASVDQLQAQIKGDEAAVDNAQTQLSYTTIKSPLDGRAGFRTVDPGNIVHASATTGIVSIVKLQPISVVFTAPEEQVPAINKSLAAGEVPVEALSSDGETLLSNGHLALVNNQVDQASGDIQMKATFANKDNILWPGLSVSTRLLLQTIKNVVTVPSDAVQRGPNGLFVYLIEGDKAKIAAVKVAQEGAGLSLIESGVNEGDVVAVAGQSRLADGLTVQATQAPAATPSPESTTADAGKAP